MKKLLGLVIWISACIPIGEEGIEIPGGLLGPASEIDWPWLDWVGLRIVLREANSMVYIINICFLINKAMNL